jgi:hypothetical protein
MDGTTAEPQAHIQIPRHISSRPPWLVEYARDRAGAILMKSTARLSACGAYRFVLTRTWDQRPVLLVVMFNPSNATHERDDPTITLLCHIASHNGYGGIVVVNAIPLISSTPAESPWSTRRTCGRPGTSATCCTRTWRSSPARSRRPARCCWGGVRWASAAATRSTRWRGGEAQGAEECEVAAVASFLPGVGHDEGTVTGKWPVRLAAAAEEGVA